MLLDFEVKTCSRQCAETGKTLEAGEVYFSLLEVQESETIRRDFSAEAWQGAPDGSLGWWRSRVPTKNEKPRLAPSEVMLNLFAALADKPADAQFRYLLGLLLIRKRILRRDDATRNDAGQEILILFAPRRGEQYELLVDEPDATQAEQIQQRMIDLLYGDGEVQPDDAEANTESDAA